MWKLNNALINKLWIKEEITMEIRKYFKLNDNEDISNQKDTAKAVHRGKVMLLNVYIRKGERLKINHPHFHLNMTEKEEEIETKVSRKIKLIEEWKSMIQKMDRQQRKVKNWFFEQLIQLIKYIVRQ